MYILRFAGRGRFHFDENVFKYANTHKCNLGGLKNVILPIYCKLIKIYIALIMHLDFIGAVWARKSISAHMIVTMACMRLFSKTLFT